MTAGDQATLSQGPDRTLLRCHQGYMLFEPCVKAYLRPRWTAGSA